MNTPTVLVHSPADASPLQRLVRHAKRPWVQLVLVALLAFAVYANSIPNGFVLDDCGIIDSNPSVTELEWSRIWAENYWPSPEGPLDILYRPLTIFTYLCNHAIAGKATWAYHLVNVLLHALVSVMVALLAQRLFASWPVAVITGLLFAVHPIHTEVVANVVGRAELLAALWSLAALLIFLPQNGLIGSSLTPRPWWHGLLVAACFMLALLSKETPAALLGAFLFLDVFRWAHAEGPRPALWRWAVSRLLRYHLLLWVTFGIYLAMRMHAVGLMMDNRAIHYVVNPLVIADVPQRIFTPFLLLTRYMLLMVYPAVLSSDYSYPSIMPTANPLNPHVLLGMLMVLAAVAACIGYWRRHPHVVATLVLFAFAYALVANVIRIGTIFGERLFYWPSVFVSMLAAFGAVWLWRRLGATPRPAVYRLAVAALGVAVLTGYSLRTVDRNPDWASNEAMAVQTGLDNPQSAKACAWAGQVILYTYEHRDPAMLDLGVKLLTRATELCPEMGSPYWELAKHYYRSKQPGEALRYLSTAALYYGGRSDVRIAIGLMPMELWKYPEAAYVPAAEARLREHPEDPCAYLGLALARRAQGRHAEAEELLTAALVREKWFDEARAELGTLRLEAGDYVAASDHLRVYARRMPFNGDVRMKLASALMRIDPAVRPEALAEAEMNLRKADKLVVDRQELRNLRAQLVQRKAELAALAADPQP